MPSAALGQKQGADGYRVRVMEAGGHIADRVVRIGLNNRVRAQVLEGLKAGEQVMVDGFQKLRGKGPVNPVPWTPASTASPAKPASKG